MHIALFNYHHFPNAQPRSHAHTLCLSQCRLQVATNANLLANGDVIKLMLNLLARSIPAAIHQMESQGQAVK